MSLNETLLAIRRDFSRDEKYKLLLQYLIKIEDELRRQQKRINNLLKKNIELSNNLNATNELLGAYTGDPLSKKKFVSQKAYDRLMKAKTMWEVRFWELNAELNTLKQKQNATI